MFCGTRSFSRVDDDGGGGGGGDDSSPATSKKKMTTRTTKITSDKKTKRKNPYSGRGLDKFYALLADLNARKQKITCAGDSLQAIWFEHSSSHDWIPLVVKLPAEPWRSAREERKNRKKTSYRDSRPSEISRKTAAVPAVEEEKVVEEEKRGRGEGRYYLFWSMEVVLGLILLCLAMTGRSFAICCTILWWYFVPVELPQGDGGGRREKKKMTTKKRDDYERRTMSLDRSMGRPAILRQQQQQHRQSFGEG